MGFATPALETGVFHGMAHYLNLLETEAVPLLSELQARGMGFIAIRPLLQGLLTDARADRKALPPGDKRLEARWDAWYARLARARATLESMGEDLSHLTSYALRICLSHPAVSTLVTGMSTSGQVDELLSALDADPPSIDALERAHRVAAGSAAIDKSTLFG
jgi:aryl-alcohol dehydrogenase-like predicted oxidoreductase